MIFIKKNKNPPKVVFIQAGHPHLGKVKWKIARRKVIEDFANNPIPFHSGNYSFTADFGEAIFRAKLLDCQGPKCCYCEKPVHNGAIEHFRPKAAYQQTRGDALTRPGYYWLAYSWENMLISCTECNQNGQKGNFFPVIGARSAYPSDCMAENSVIINPANENPANFISFNYAVPVSVDAGGRGTKIFQYSN